MRHVQAIAPKEQERPTRSCATTESAQILRVPQDRKEGGQRQRMRHLC